MSGRWLSRGVVALALVVAGIGAVPSPAAADHQVGTAYVSWDILYVNAGTTVANQVTVSNSANGELVVTDGQAELRVDPARSGGCRQHEAWAIVCPTSVVQVTARLGDGNDDFRNYSNRPTFVYGDAGDDDLWGWYPREYFYGGDGNDELYGLFANDTLSGDAGNDLLEGHEGNDTLYGGDGDDILRGAEGDDKTFGHSGVNDVTGGPGRDTLYTSGRDQARGEDGDDTLVQWAYNSTADYYGGPGVDTIAYDQAHAITGFNVSLNDVADDGANAHWYIPHNVHSDVEHVIGSPYDDRIVGSDLANTVLAGSGDDRVEGRGGDDDLDAQQGSAQNVAGDGGSDRCAGEGLIPHASCERIG